MDLRGQYKAFIDLCAVTHLGVQKSGKRYPDVFVTKRPCSKVEDCLLWVRFDLLQKLSQPLSFRGKAPTNMINASKRRVEIYLIQLLAS